MNVAGPIRPRPVPLAGGDYHDGQSSSSSSASAAAWTDADMYSDVPSFELSLDEFEECALARLKVLRKIEEMKARNLPPDEFRRQLDASIKSNLAASSPGGDSKKVDPVRSKRIDVASHFILRAAYCRSEDLRRWFLTNECLLFKHRLSGLVQRSGGGAGGNHDGLRDFLSRNKFDLDRVSRAEKEELRAELLSVPGAPGPVEFHAAEYYKVPFVRALDLVRRREVYLRGGMAYVPLARAVSIVELAFRNALSRSLTMAAGVFNNELAREEGGRIAPLLKSMNNQHTGPGAPEAVVGADGEVALTAATVDALATQSMPLCMRQLHAGMKRDHKLKHQARLQYGLFLKGAGMSLEDHTLFFQREFTKLMTGEQFNKQYGYSIRHMHGKEGKRANYTPYNCTKIIVGNPPQSAVEHHGCPYKHYDDANLSALLGKLNVGTAGERDQITSLKKAGQYQLACAKHFEAAHPGAAAVEGVSLDGVGNHPNAWFKASVSYHEAMSGGGSAGDEVVKQEGAV